MEDKNKATVSAAKHSEEILQLVSFNIGTEEFGIDILKVQEINRMVDITRVPRAPRLYLSIPRCMAMTPICALIPVAPRRSRRNFRPILIVVVG